MAHKINPEFLNELLSGILSPLLQYIQSDDTLNLELRGDRVIIYYRGGALLTVKQYSFKFISLSPKYHKGKPIITPTLSNLEIYIPQAKHAIDQYVIKDRNHLWEKDIQQQIARENNHSPNSLDTDYFVIDTEYQDKGRFDIVALRWDSKGSIRKLPKSFKPTITIFEVKQGYHSLAGKSGMKSHQEDFNNFCSSIDVDLFKNDMISVFCQKRLLGLIRGMDKYKEITEVNPNIEFVFLLANYKHDSTQLRKALNTIDNCNFIYANPMGYGLYARNIIDKNEFLKRFL